MGLTTGSFPPVELVLFALAGVLVATFTSGVDPFDPSAWWDEPLVYQKLVLWTLLLECLGRSGAPAAETQSAGGW
jgi:Transmembrane protein of unknown function (DUF3556)